MRANQGSQALVLLRREVEEEWERVRDACDAANVIAARRGAPAIPCD
jgi:hypothetical protein